MRKLLLTLLILGLCTGTSFAGPPSRTFSYSVGAIINPVQNTTNEDAIFSYLSSGVDTYSPNSITAADIATGGVGTAEILNGTITSVDISATAAIPYSKLTFTNNIVAGDIATGAIGSSELASTAVTAGTYTACDLTVDADGRITSATSGTIDLTSEVSGDLPITEGGTGQSTAQTAIDALLPSQAGNSGKFLTTNATNASWGTAIRSELFTSSGTFTAPTGVTTVFLTMCGGGGGGGGSGSATRSGGGGGGLSCYRVAYTVVAGNNYTVTVGAGGAGGAGGGANNGSTGGASSFDTTISVDGGLGGTGEGAGAAAVADEAVTIMDGSGITGGRWGIKFGAGGGSGGAATGGGGGGSRFGNGGNGGTQFTNGYSPTYGFGGGGGGSGQNPYSGGAGASGFVYIEW